LGNAFRKGRRQALRMSEENTEGHYDVQEVEMGEVYTWLRRPRPFVVVSTLQVSER
jgi:hypothetical protein